MEKIPMKMMKELKRNRKEYEELRNKLYSTFSKGFKERPTISELIKTLETKDFEIRENVSFKTLTTYKTGGICKYLVSPKNIDSL